MWPTLTIVLKEPLNNNFPSAREKRICGKVNKGLCHVVCGLEQAKQVAA